MIDFICRQCKIQLTVVNAEPHYGINKTRYTTPFQLICKRCIRHNRSKRKRKRLIEIKLNRGCDKCGYKQNAAALDFHHKDSETKEWCVGSMVTTNRTTKQMEAEIDKCILLCSNCHRENHFPQMDKSYFV